jgi:antitoxin component YwqK of YwqJK toxin-antitoxin module
VVTEDAISSDILYARESYKPYTGKCTVYYYASSQVKSEYTFRDGVLNGPALTWHMNGKLKKKGCYHNGQLSGTWVFYDEQGRKMMEANYKGNELNGAYTALYKNGTIREKGQFSEKEQKGTWAFYNENGTIIRKIQK